MNTNEKINDWSFLRILLELIIKMGLAVSTTGNADINADIKPLPKPNTNTVCRKKVLDNIVGNGPIHCYECTQYNFFPKNVTEWELMAFGLRKKEFINADFEKHDLGEMSYKDVQEMKRAGISVKVLD